MLLFSNSYVSIALGNVKGFSKKKWLCIGFKCYQKKKIPAKSYPKKIF